MYKVLLFTLFSWVLVGFSCYSQSDSTLFENDSIAIKVNFERCNKPSKGTDINYIYLSFENKTDFSLKVNYQIKKWYNGICYGCDNNSELKYSIDIDSHQIISGNCDSSNKALRIFDSMNNGMTDKKLTKHKLEVLTIKTLGNE